MTDTKHSAVEREAFEAWVCKKFSIKSGRVYRREYGDQKGQYVDPAIQLAWEADQQARAAIAAAAPAGQLLGYVPSYVLERFEAGELAAMCTITRRPLKGLGVITPIYTAPVPAAAPKAALTDEQSESAALKAVRAAIEWFAENGKNECYGRDWFPVEPEFVTLARAAIGE